MFEEIFYQLTEEFQKFTQKLKDFGSQDECMPIEFHENIKLNFKKELVMRQFTAEEQGKQEAQKQADNNSNTFY